MKDAQDAVKEIREWPVQKYLIENEDGSIEFSDNKPGRVVCSKDEFMEAKSSVVKSVEGGDLPPVGEECEIDSHCAGSFFLCIPKYHGVNSSVVEIWIGDIVREVWIQRKHAKFRPLKSDRERWVEGAMKIYHDNASVSVPDAIGDIYDALKSGELPMPEKD